MNDPVSSPSEAPIFAVVIGVVCAGKTTFRRERFKLDYVVLDAGEIFLSLNDGSWSGFGKIQKKEMEEIGAQTALNAIVNRRNLVTEILPSFPEQTAFILKTFQLLGYQTQVFDLDCDLETSVKRNENREKNNISAYFTETHHINWLIAALKKCSDSLLVDQQSSEFTDAESNKEKPAPDSPEKINAIAEYEVQIFDEDIEDYTFNRGNLSAAKIQMIKELLGHG